LHGAKLTNFLDPKSLVTKIPCGPESVKTI
jgi:hypothetical protein